MSVLRDLKDRAAARPAHIVMSEGTDPRVVAGALAALDAGMGPITLVGAHDEVTETATRARARFANVIDAFLPILAEG